MGWEWHNRHRKENGRFADQGKTMQLHIRCSLRDWELIREQAKGERKSMTEYLLHLATEDGRKNARQAYTDDRKRVGGGNMKGSGRDQRMDLDEKLHKVPMGGYLYVMDGTDRYYRYECGKPVRVSAKEVEEVKRLRRMRS